MSLHAERAVRDGIDRLRTTAALALAAVLVLIVGILTLWLILGAIRTFASDERQTIRREHLTRNAVPAIANAVVGTVAYGLPSRSASRCSWPPASTSR